MTFGDIRRDKGTKLRGTDGTLTIPPMTQRNLQNETTKVAFRLSPLNSLSAYRSV
jgi:hypothetical protein